ncbi:hypothetical protein [Actinophytocola sp.]|jgi:hypothetical protein|uniref:hypothetical protein n=1 Tax=Actinophytocola sp. TaxID=1872138 RepID=UPI002EDA3BB4
MGLFELTDDRLTAVPTTTFAAEGVLERRDLQRVLRDNIGAIDDSLLVVAEEFGDFDGSGRRIDLLCVDREARLVVVELKRTHDGGHMELQALRYAAMVSSMTFDNLVDIFERHLSRTDPATTDDARTTLTDWLEGTEDDEPVISAEVRIVLVSSGFGTEITTTVLWLNNVYDLDISCVKLVPHRVDGRLLLDITQLIPLPEAEEFTIKLRRREQAVRAAASGRDWTQYVITSPSGTSEPLRKRWAVLEMVKVLHEAGVPGATLADALPNARFLNVVGTPTGDDLIEAYCDSYSRMRRNIGKWFLDQPIRDQDQTWVLSKMWGRQTVPALDKLVALAPHDGFGYRAV